MTDDSFVVHKHFVLSFSQPKLSIVTQATLMIMMIMMTVFRMTMILARCSRMRPTWQHCCCTNRDSQTRTRWWVESMLFSWKLFLVSSVNIGCMNCLSGGDPGVNNDIWRTLVTRHSHGHQHWSGSLHCHCFRTELSEMIWWWSLLQPVSETISSRDHSNHSLTPAHTGPTPAPTSPDSMMTRRSCPWTTPSWTRTRSWTTTAWTGSTSGRWGRRGRWSSATPVSRPEPTLCSRGEMWVRCTPVTTVSIWSDSWVSSSINLGLSDPRDLILLVVTSRCRSTHI